jgi:uncharacterized protein
MLMPDMIQRILKPHLLEQFRRYPVVTITGPRQSGKTTLARSTFPDLPYRNLERLEERDFAREDPVGFLKSLRNGAIIDEIQNVPELTSSIQAEVDDRGVNGLFVLTGSRQFNLMESVSQSLAGRTSLIKLLPFSLQELAGSHHEQQVLREPRPSLEFIRRGFYPRLYDQGIEPVYGLRDYIETYIERDLRSMSQVQDLLLFRTFLKLCAGRIGQILNTSSLAQDLGLHHTTVRHWINLLEASYIVFRLPPFTANISKRLVRSPKLYFFDTGLAANLLGIETVSHVETHPLRGALFENLVVGEVLKHRYNQGLQENLSFFRDAKGHEVDLIYHRGAELTGIEIKAAATMRSEYFQGLEYVHQWVKPLHRRIVAYDGDRDEERTRGIVTNAFKITRYL